MKQPSVYLKMRVLGAVDTVAGRTREERIHNVAAMIFLDEEGHPRQFTWRTIQTWYYRYRNYGITGMTSKPRKDKGAVRKVTPEELLEAIRAAQPHFHNKRTNKMALYRFCIQKGLLQPDRISQTTFYRFIREHDLLAPDESHNKKRLAFSMKHANQLWQADTMFGPHVETGPVHRITQTGEADRLHRRCQPCPLPRRILLRGERRYTHPIDPRCLL